jgi:hypothetical protein
MIKIQQRVFDICLDELGSYFVYIDPLKISYIHYPQYTGVAGREVVLVLYVDSLKVDLIFNTMEQAIECVNYIQSCI